MKKIQILNLKKAFLLTLIFTVSLSCERALSDDVVLATFQTNPNVFTDAPAGLTDEFFISFDPASGANTEGFGTDDNEAYEGTSSIRIDVPAPNDPNGGFIGGIFRDRGEGRDLSGYDALTFWMKGSTTASVSLLGFGTDFLEDKFPVSIANKQLSTDWRKVIIPLPDASRLTQEKGMFVFAAGTESTGGVGFTFWIDEIKFEKLGTLKLQNYFIQNGNEVGVNVFTGVNQRVTGLGAIYNLPTGNSQTITISPNYFDFKTDNTSVTGNFTFNQAGEIITPIIGKGKATVTAEVANILATGALVINGQGDFPHAPIPTATNNVVSIFSDAYSNIPVRHYNGFFAPFQTTEGGAGSDPNNLDIKAPFANGVLDNIINYTKLNFVSIGMYEAVPNIDVSATNTLHIDINVRENIDNGDFIRIQLESGTGSGTTSGGSFSINAAALRNADANGWVSLDIPLSRFSGFNSRTNLGQLFFISDNTVSNIWVDNVYFYTN